MQNMKKSVSSHQLIKIRNKYMPDTICTTCGNQAKVIPAGISKAGKPYASFISCNVCKPYNSGGSTPQAPQKESVDWDKIGWGKCKYGFLIEAFKMKMTLEEATPLAIAFANESMLPKPLEKPQQLINQVASEMAEPGNEIAPEDIPFNQDLSTS